MELTREYTILDDDNQQHNLIVSLHIGLKEYQVTVDDKEVENGHIEDDLDLNLNIAGRPLEIQLIYHGFPEIKVFHEGERIVPGSVQGLRELIEKREQEGQGGFFEKYRNQIGIGGILLVVLILLI